MGWAFLGTKREASRGTNSKEFTRALYEIEAPPGPGPLSAGPPVQVQSVSKRIVSHSFPLLLNFGWDLPALSLPQVRTCSPPGLSTFLSSYGSFFDHFFFFFNFLHHHTALPVAVGAQPLVSRKREEIARKVIAKRRPEVGLCGKKGRPTRRRQKKTASGFLFSLR